LIKLAPWNFLAVFAKSGYPQVKEEVVRAIQKTGAAEKEYQKILDNGTPFSTKALSFLKDNAYDILAAIPVVKDFVPPLKSVAKLMTRTMTK
jgi:hypothetical protein